MTVSKKNTLPICVDLSLVEFWTADSMAEISKLLMHLQ